MENSDKTKIACQHFLEENPFPPIFSLVYSCNKKSFDCSWLMWDFNNQPNASKAFKIFHRKILLSFIMFVQHPEIQESLLIPEKFICRITELDV